MARYCQAIHGHQAIHGWPGPSADGLGPSMAPNKTQPVQENLQAPCGGYQATSQVRPRSDIKGTSGPLLPFSLRPRFDGLPPQGKSRKDRVRPLLVVRYGQTDKIAPLQGVCHLAR